MTYIHSTASFIYEMSTITKKPEDRLREILSERDRKNQEKEEWYKPVSKALDSIRTNNIKRVLEYIWEYSPKDHSEIFIETIKQDGTNPSVLHIICNKLATDDFSNLSDKLASKLLKKQRGGDVLKNLSKFSNLSFETAKQLIDNHQRGAFMVARMIKSFNISNHRNIALYLIGTGHEENLINELPAFDRRSLEG